MSAPVHATQSPVHAASQHTPSTQWPVRHWPSAVHAFPPAMPNSSHVARTSAPVVPSEPIASACPEGSVTNGKAKRASDMSPPGDHAPVFGSKSSALGQLPPATRAIPLARRTALAKLRPCDRVPAVDHTSVVQS